VSAALTLVVSACADVGKPVVMATVVTPEPIAPALLKGVAEPKCLPEPSGKGEYSVEELEQGVICYRSYGERVKVRLRALQKVLKKRKEALGELQKKG